MNKYDPSAIRTAFRFLVDEFGYTVAGDDEFSHDGRPYAFVIEYISAQRRVRLDYDCRDNFFYFYLMRGPDTVFPNDADQENIRSFWQLFKSVEPQLELDAIQPDEQTCAQAAEANAELIRKYCSSILRGEEWV